MKAIKFFFVLILSSLIFTHCTDESVKVSQVNNEDANAVSESRNSNARTQADIPCNNGVCPAGKKCVDGYCYDVTIVGNCGGLRSGNFSTISTYHQYSVQSMTITSGVWIQISIDPKDIPNRFIIKNQSGSTIYSSGWIGTASYSGPWGMSLSKPGVIYPAPIFGVTSLTIHTETQTPPNYSYSPTTDYWDVNVTCFTF